MADIKTNTESWVGHNLTEVEAHLKKCALYEMLAKSPEIIKRGSTYEISHPLIDYPGAECIIVVYHRKTCKKRSNVNSGDWEDAFGKTGTYKKGYCVCTNRNWDGLNSCYFDFLEYSDIDDVKEFFRMISGRKLTCGIVLRIPNPDYNGPITRDRNATYKGVKEMLWSDVRRIKISKLNNVTGIGITI